MVWFVFNGIICQLVPYSLFRFQCTIFNAWTFLVITKCFRLLAVSTSQVQLFPSKQATFLVKLKVKVFYCKKHAEGYFHIYIPHSSSRKWILFVYSNRSWFYSWLDHCSERKFLFDICETPAYLSTLHAFPWILLVI